MLLPTTNSHVWIEVVQLPTFICCVGKKLYEFGSVSLLISLHWEEGSPIVTVSSPIVSLLEGLTYHTNLCSHQITESIEPLHICLNVACLLHVSVQGLHAKTHHMHVTCNVTWELCAVHPQILHVYMCSYIYLCLFWVLDKCLNELLGAYVVQSFLQRQVVWHWHILTRGCRGKTHHFNVSELLCQYQWVITQLLNVDLCLGVDKSFHGYCIYLSQDMLVLVQNTQSLHQGWLHLPHWLSEVLWVSQRSQ